MPPPPPSTRPSRARSNGRDALQGAALKCVDKAVRRPSKVAAIKPSEGGALTVGRLLERLVGLTTRMEAFLEADALGSAAGLDLLLELFDSALTHS